MEYKNDNDLLIINNENMKASDVFLKLAAKDATALKNLLLENEIKVPRIINMVSLRKVINPYIVKAKEMHLSDEMLYRLRTYPKFSEFQLQSLYKLVCDETNDFYNYKAFLFEILFRNCEKLGLTDAIIKKMLELPNGQDDFSHYQDNIFAAFSDYGRQFDGLTTNDLLDNLPKSATANDIRDMGAKYGFSIPKRLKKEEMQAIILKELKKQRKLDEAMNEKVASLPIMGLQRLAKDNNIKVSIDLKKEDLIAYLLSEIEKANLPSVAYLPLDLEINDGFEFDLSYVMNEEIKVEPIVSNEVITNEVVEPAKEEVITKVESPVTSTVDIDLITKAIKESFNSAVSELTSLVADKVSEATNKIAENMNEAYIKAKTEKELVVKPLQPIVNVYNNKEECNTEESSLEKVEHIYPYDNFTNQLNPFYDSELAAKIDVADKKFIEPQYENTNQASASNPTLAEVKLIQKQEKKAAKKENKAFVKEQKKLQKEEMLRKYKEDRQAIKEKNKNEKLMKKAIRTGKVEGVNKDYFDEQMRLREYDLLRRQASEQKRNRRNSIIFGIIKFILLIALLLVLAWAVFVGLFAYDKAANVKSVLEEYGLYNPLFAKAVEYIKNLINK